MIDGLILAVPRALLASFAVFSFADSVRMHPTQFFAESGDFFGSLKLAFIVFCGLGMLYYVLLNGLGTGQTLGNRALGIAVRDVNNGLPIGVGRSFVRSLVRTSLYATLLIPAFRNVPAERLLLWAPGLLNDLFPLFDARRQTIADKFARSTVVKIH